MKKNDFCPPFRRIVDGLSVVQATNQVFLGQYLQLEWVYQPIPQLDDKFVPFAQTISNYANEFKLPKIRLLIEKYLENN
ncbi:MAG: hypothetical protein F6J94_31015 [Moorea sp. SIO1F2]|uniref:hypothetical protein n=1 Tax=unclassified Moorena TaxID=2683338 RepID=UPI0013BC79DC|nr:MULTISPECIES: hypothetical protein [unclassified Moorena]NEN97954.1 hypothetical protein [Moorena sp. SIO3I7]NEO08257.1 hypothetical protein [Moorena sp. SIO3I8]NEO22542.1 hypothetical protein [Moorena sp. SIO4A5]NEP25381.1 hypothetical protein [Moorena sp. SIO3I6]NEQ60106.1 hypothetical protein [Moorena sp. SIO4A1]